MGILSKTVSVCQYQVQGDVPAEGFFEWAAERLAQNSFQAIDHTSEEMSIGWVHQDDFKETGFEVPQDYWRDQYLVFSLRRDQRRVPAALLRSRMEMAEKEFLAANPGMHKVAKNKKEELRDAVRGSLLAKTLPAPSVFDVVWDTRTNVIYFSSLSAKVMEFFEALFKQTFDGLSLVPIHPFARAEKVVEPSLAEALKQSNGTASEAVLDLIRDNSWIGTEFLLWMLHQTLTSSGDYRVNQEGPALKEEGFVAYLNDRMTLIGGGDDGMQKMTVTGSQDRFSEVRTALQTGKQITEAVLYLEKRENEWRMNLKGEQFLFASLRTPSVILEKGDIVDAATEREAVFYQKISLLEEGLQLFDSLFSEFLRQRLSAGWDARQQQIVAWLSEE